MKQYIIEIKIVMVKTFFFSAGCYWAILKRINKFKLNLLNEYRYHWILYCTFLTPTWYFLYVEMHLSHLRYHCSKHPWNSLAVRLLIFHAVPCFIQSTSLGIGKRRGGVVWRIMRLIIDADGFSRQKLVNNQC